MEQLPLFDEPQDRNAQQLVAIREYLTCWTEAERRKRLADVKNPQRDRLGNAAGNLPMQGEEVVMRLSLSGSTGNAAQQGSFQADNPAASRAGHSGGR